MEKVYLWVKMAPFILVNGSMISSMVSDKNSLKIKAAMRAIMSMVRSMDMGN